MSPATTAHPHWTPGPRRSSVLPSPTAAAYVDGESVDRLAVAMRNRISICWSQADPIGVKRNMMSRCVPTTPATDNPLGVGTSARLGEDVRR
jgi:hypothetical protein